MTNVLPGILLALIGLGAIASGPLPVVAQDDGFFEDLQGVRKNYEKQFKFDLDRDQKPQNPEIAGTKLIVSAMTQLSAENRARQIDSTVTLLRNHPEIVEGVFTRAVNWIRNNPQMADHAREVLRSIATRLDSEEPEPEERFPLPGGY